MSARQRLIISASPRDFVPAGRIRVEPGSNEYFEPFTRPNLGRTVGVALSGVAPEEAHQPDLFDKPGDARLVTAIDELNAKFGKGAITYGAAAADRTSKVAFQRVPKVKEFREGIATEQLQPPLVALSGVILAGRLLARSRSRRRRRGCRLTLGQQGSS